MPPIARYLSHPQVVIDPDQDIRHWGLNDTGEARVRALVASGALAGTTRVVSSTETKALETAAPIAHALGCPLEEREAMHENDRSATGFLPPEEFERTADQFFAHPHQSIRGWERATDAQARIWREVTECLAPGLTGDILFVGHGGVGTLLYCRLARQPITRRLDQLPGGGCWFAFSPTELAPLSHWAPMESLAVR
jgi:broad specificity phosphatase PhoE